MYPRIPVHAIVRLQQHGWLQRRSGGACTSQTTTTTSTTTQTTNEFNRPWSTNFAIQDQFSIYLGHAHWEGGKLILHVYVTNGYDHRIVQNQNRV